MYQIVVIIFFVIMAGWVFWTVKSGNFTTPKLKILLQKTLVSKKEFIKLKGKSYSYALRILFYQITLALFFLLAVSGFVPIMITGGHLSGIPLIIHVTIAPFFCVSLALSVLFWVYFLRFDSKDWDYIKGLNQKRKKKHKAILDINFWQKVNFWTFATISLPAITSIILGMYPIFGTSGQEILIELHRYSTLLLFIVVLFHIYLLFIKLNNESYI